MQRFLFEVSLNVIIFMNVVNTKNNERCRKSNLQSFALVLKPKTLPSIPQGKLVNRTADVYHIPLVSTTYDRIRCRFSNSSRVQSISFWLAEPRVVGPNTMRTCAFFRLLISYVQPAFQRETKNARP